MGWLLIPAELMIGFFRGAAMTLTYSYAVDSSEKYAEVQEETTGSYKPIEIDKTQKSAKVRDFLFALEGVGRGAGYIIGPGIKKSYIYVDKLYMYCIQFMYIIIHVVQHMKVDRIA